MAVPCRSPCRVTGASPDSATRPLRVVKSGGGDLAGTGTGTPLIEVWGSETARGGSGGTSSEPDPVTGWSAYRRAQYCHLVIDVTAPRFWGGRTSMHILAIDPTQSGSTITSVSGEAVMDSVTLVRNSVTGPAPGHPHSQHSRRG